VLLSSAIPESALSDIAGTWEVAGHVEPGISGMSKTHACTGSFLRTGNFSPHGDL
jgi:hypothetical protein